MTPQKILWFSEAEPLYHKRLREQYHLEYLPLPFSLRDFDFSRAFSAAVIQIKKESQNAIRLLKQLKNYNFLAPVIVTAHNLTKKEVIEIFRAGATEYIEHPVDEEGLISLIKWHIGEKVTGKISKIQSLLQDLGQQILAIIYNSHNIYLIAPQMLPLKATKKNSARGITARFLGKFDLTINGKTCPDQLSKREKSLLAYLVFHADRPIHRDRLIAKFWSDSLSDCARNSLNVTITGIRRHLHRIDPTHDYIVYHNQMYRFAPEVSVETDVSIFWQYFQEAQELEKKQQVESALYTYYKAFGIYRDDFLPDLGDEDWVYDQRDRLREKYIVVLTKLGEYFLIYQQYDFAIELFNKILEIDDCYEQAHWQLMLCYHNQNMRNQVIRQFQKCEAVLQRKLRIRPSRETCELYEKVLS